MTPPADPSTSESSSESPDRPERRRPPRALSYSETARGLRSLLYTSGALGAFAQMVGLQMAVFTGFALSLGASDSSIAHFVAIASLTSLAQILSSSLLIRRIKRKKAFVILMGCLFSLMRFTVVLIPLFLAQPLRVPAIGLLVGMGLVCWHVGAPVYMGWQANVIPEGNRARFLGRQNIANLLAGIVASYLAGWFLDLFPGPDKYAGFVTIFAVATLLGLFAFLNMSRVPFVESGDDSAAGSFLTPFRDRRFVKLLLFFGSLNFAWMLATPFYNVFMLKSLGIGYTTVAILNSFFMATMVVGSKVVGDLADRYGSKVVLTILILPAILTPVLWTFNRPDNYGLIPFAMAINGIIFSGSLVAVNAQLFSIVPKGPDRSTYFAAWFTTVFLFQAAAPLLGGSLVSALESTRFVVFGFPVGNLQLIFLCSGVAMVLPNLLLRLVKDAKGTTTGQLIDEIGRGNLIGYIYHSMVYDLAGSERRRASAVHSLGRSKSPMALERLVRALSDASPEVRRQAARGLGEARSARALEPLVEELQDEESDIRGEAAEALGKIGHPAVVDPLVDALEGPDERIQISAIRALSELGSDEAAELLFWKFAESFDRSTFPTLADVLGRRRDLRIIRPVLQRLSGFHSTAIRLQLLNSVCRALGARGRYYRLVSQDELSRAGQIDAMLDDVTRAIRRTRALPKADRARLLAEVRQFREAVDDADQVGWREAGVQIADVLEATFNEAAVGSVGEDAAYRIGAAVLAIRSLFGGASEYGKPESIDVFMTVLLWTVGDALRDSEGG